MFKKPKRRLFTTIALTLSVFVGFGMPLGDASMTRAAATEPAPSSDPAAESDEAVGEGEHDAELELDDDSELGNDTEAETLPELDALQDETHLEPAQAPAELLADSPENIADGLSLAPFAAGDSMTPNAYFSLRQQGTAGGSGDDRGTISAIIDKYVVDTSNPATPALAAQSSDHPTLSASVPLEGDRQPDVMPPDPGYRATQVQYRVRQSDYSVDSLGVAADGTAYFTTQFYQEQRQRTAACSTVIIFGACVFGEWGWPDWSSWSPASGTGGGRYLSIWQVNLESGTASRPVERNTIVIPASATVTGGAVDSDGQYYFSYLEAGGTNAITYRVYRLVGSTPSLAVTATTANNTSIGSFSGDIAFDGYDNLFLLVGGTGTSSRLAMLRANQVPATGNSTVTNLASTLVTQTNPGTGNQPAGIAFPISNHMVWQTGSTHVLRSAAAPGTVVSSQSYANYPYQRDLASITKRPTFQLRVVVDNGRVTSTDQFILRATPGSSEQTRTANTPEGEGAPAYLAANPISVTRALDSDPLPGTTTNPSATVPFSVTGGPATNLAHYEQSHACVDLTSGMTLVSGSGAAGTVEISTLGNPNIECTVTLTRAAPELTVTKQAFVGGSLVADNTLINPGTQVEYRLAFNNSGGTVAAEDIDFTDYLADVLDDADFVTGSLTITGGGGLSVTGVDGFGALTGDTLGISGSVPAGASRTVSFAVIVKPNSENVESRAGMPVLPPAVPADGGGYRLTNYLVETGEGVPTSCETSSNLCTTHPIRAFNVTKRSQPGSGASMNVGGTPNYTIIVEKSDASMPLHGVQVIDDLTDVLHVASWDPTIIPPAPALPAGIYFYDANNVLVDSISASNLPPGTVLSDWIPDPVYNDTHGTWTLTTAAFDLPAAAKFAHVRFSVRLGVAQQAPAGSVNWNPVTPPEPDTQFHNRAWASTDTTGLVPNRCAVGTPAAELPNACKTTHTLVSNVLAFRKDGIITDEAGNVSKVEDLAGHEFVIYQADAAGNITSDLPANACVNWNTPDLTDPGDGANCWRFYPIPDGAQKGRWRSENLTAGHYWLVETRAADQRNVNGVLEPISDIQLLAEPIPFRVASAADAAPAGSVPIVNGQPAFLRVGQMDVFTSTTSASGSVTPRCDTVNWPAACVNPTGFLMIVSDVKLGPLPLTGGAGMTLLIAGGATILAVTLTVAWWWRRRDHASADSPSNSGGSPR